MVIEISRFKRSIISLLVKMNINPKRFFPRPSTEFINLIFGDKPLVGVEVGVFKGENSLDMLNRLNIQKLLLIDPYEEYDELTDDIDN